ncbi:MAG: amidohydrolase family protein [Acidobacteriota bacterium]|jgi:cytosine/adenosine deaminase-related metal-dependent hydrolase|nr:amidohydrolase family protein [Acidobacteriota bacterium]
MSPKVIHRARFILTHPEILLENTAVLVSEDGRVLEPCSQADARTETGAEIIDWGDAIIMPGLVNAHTHLELTALYGRLREFSSFTDWAFRLIKERRTWTPEDYRRSTEEGARLSLASGTTLVGDIASGNGWSALSGECPRRVVFEETLGLDPELAAPAMAGIHAVFDQAGREETRPVQVHAVSPHAPYSTSGELYRRAAAFAENRKAPWTTHAAETTGELRFFKTGDGEFREFLTRLGALPENWRAPGLHPVAWLDALGVLGPSCLLVHCNYLDEDAIARIARSKSSVVYCPRSHAFFGHEKHPIRRLLNAGIPVALGTDSLASNDSLSILDEMRYLYARRKDLTPEEILRAATIHGAAALGFTDRLGRLTSGFFADMTVLNLPPGIKSPRLIDQILEGAGSWRATVINGRVKSAFL